MDKNKQDKLRGHDMKMHGVQKKYLEKTKMAALVLMPGANKSPTGRVSVRSSNGGNKRMRVCRINK